LHTVLDARAYMLGLSKGRELNTRWQRAAKLLLAEADVGDFSKQVELACSMKASWFSHENPNAFRESTCWTLAGAAYSINLAFRAASLACWHAAGSVSATPRAITVGPGVVITSQYQRPSPLCITRNSTFSAMLHLPSSIYRLYQSAFRCATIRAKKRD